MRRVLVWVCIVVGTCVADEAIRVVQTLQGPVRGYRDPQWDVYAFYSIPYATAPTGPNKFKEPLPPPTWTETFDAVDKKIVCPQQSSPWTAMVKEEIIYQEDCLMVNVFVPNTEEINLPVVVYVHGGAFQIGFGNALLHWSLVSSGKVIEVNFNYRLGAHGFLCLGTEDIPGNAGMKDQVAALRWVKRNIGNFGGNPEDVTLAGYSAGGSSVELLLVSKSTQGLFNKVIPESGGGFGVWTVQADPTEIAYSYARSLGFDTTDNVYDVEEFFKDLSLDVLQGSYSFMDRSDSTFYFAPCVEREDTKNPFLIEAPTEIIKNRDYTQLPMLTGFADMEGILRLPLFDQWKNDMNKDFSAFLPADLTFRDDNERQRVIQKIKEVYFGDQPIGDDTVVGYVNYFSDVMFAYPTYRSVSHHASAGSDSLYLYVYAFVDNRTSIPYPDITGADHGAQAIALGDSITWLSVSETHNWKKMKQLLSDVWKNFIITGKPTPEGSLAARELGGEWKPVEAGRWRHALFNSTSSLRAALWPERMALWDDIYSRHHRAPVPPYAPTQPMKTEL